jgi:hypothetical protein
MVALCLMTALLVVPQNAPAAQAPPFYECSIDQINRTNDGYTAVNLTDTLGTFTNQCFIIPASQAKEYMAIILTAISTTKNVIIYCDPSTPHPPPVYTEIKILYLYNK